MKTLKYLCAVICISLLSACASPTSADYANEKPVLNLQQYFNGTLHASGMFQDRSGKVIKRFSVVMDCSWDGDIGTLKEDFSYSDGSTQQRIWTLRKTGPNNFIGTAPDVVGEAVGTTAGNTLHWNYTLALPVDGKIVNVQLDDWMYLIDDHIMLNRAVMSKFGFSLGSITLSFTKHP